MITVTFNNKYYSIEENCSVAEFIRQQNIASSNIAVAVNNRILPSTQWAEVTLNDKDKIVAITASYGG